MNWMEQALTPASPPPVPQPGIPAPPDDFPPPPVIDRPGVHLMLSWSRDKGWFWSKSAAPDLRTYWLWKQGLIAGEPGPWTWERETGEVQP